MNPTVRQILWDSILGDNLMIMRDLGKFRSARGPPARRLSADFADGARESGGGTFRCKHCVTRRRTSFTVAREPNTQPIRTYIATWDVPEAERYVVEHGPERQWNISREAAFKGVRNQGHVYDQNYPKGNDHLLLRD